VCVCVCDGAECADHCEQCNDAGHCDKCETGYTVAEDKTCKGQSVAHYSHSVKTEKTASNQGRSP